MRKIFSLIALYAMLCFAGCKKSGPEKQIEIVPAPEPIKVSIIDKGRIGYIDSATGVCVYRDIATNKKSIYKNPNLIFEGIYKRGLEKTKAIISQFYLMEFRNISVNGEDYVLFTNKYAQSHIPSNDKFLCDYFIFKPSELEKFDAVRYNLGRNYIALKVIIGGTVADLLYDNNLVREGLLIKEIEENINNNGGYRDDKSVLSFYIVNDYGDDKNNKFYVLDGVDFNDSDIRNVFRAILADEYYEVDKKTFNKFIKLKN
jgi:hypothetical protein